MVVVIRTEIAVTHRMAFLNGVMSYCASPLWLVFLVLATLEVTRLVLWPINYFPTEHSLFPTWRNGTTIGIWSGHLDGSAAVPAKDTGGAGYRVQLENERTWRFLPATAKHFAGNRHIYHDGPLSECWRIPAT